MPAETMTFPGWGMSECQSMEVDWTWVDCDGSWYDRSLEGEECADRVGSPIAPVRLEEVTEPEEFGRISERYRRTVLSWQRDEHQYSTTITLPLMREKMLTDAK